jgi:hypothetical protein
MQSKLVVGVVVVALSAAVYFYLNREPVVDVKAAVAAFPMKRWYYSIDGGANWSSRAEGDLLRWKGNGEPVHANPVWTKSKWLDENTIEWTATNGTKSLWKTFDQGWTPEGVSQMKNYASTFPAKKWYYSVDEGIHWAEADVSELRNFDENGRPVHVSPAWISANWETENIIHWMAANGSTCVWKAFDSPPE